MGPPNVYFSAVLLAAGVGCLVVAVMVWLMHREAVGARSLFIFLIGLSWWDITYAIFWADAPAPNPYFWLDITLIGAFIVPTAFLVFALEFSHLHRWLERPFLLALTIEPLLTLILLLTDPWHNLFFGGKRALNTTMIIDAGPASWANVYYSYALIAIGVFVLGFTLYRSRGVYRMQATVILAAVIIPWVIHIGFMASNGILLENADVTPFIFSITALLIAFALIRYRLLDVVPVARSVLIESMREGVLVLDNQNRVIDINQAARSVLSPDFYLGEPVESAFKRWSDFVAHFFDADQAQTEVEIEDRYLDLRISPLHDRRRRFLGKLVVWRDITDLKNTQIKLQQLATTDELTLAYNRRHFMDMAETQLTHALRQNRPLTLALIDLDHFKNVNDNFGHAAGDKVLKEFSRLFIENIRGLDIFGRLGGEEFALLMPETDLDSAYQVSERLRQTIANTLISLEGHSVSVTFSLGLAGYLHGQDTVATLFRRADRAMYAAKHSGRNRVVEWSESLDVNLE